MSPCLFSLEPLNEPAQRIVDHPRNAEFRARIAHRNRPVNTGLSFKADRPGNTEGILLRFGQHPQSDVRLPSDAAQRYRTFHCLMWLSAETGELLLRDETGGLTGIEVLNVSATDQDKYDLHGTPRQRVIPKDSTLQFVFRIGVDSQFRFWWRDASFGSDNQQALINIARACAGPETSVEGGQSGLVDVPPVEQVSRRRLRSDLQPTVATPNKQNIPFHRYKPLGEGGFGIVYKVVDLTNGRHYAMKQLKSDVISSTVRKSLKREVEVVYRLCHENIVQLKHWQGFCNGGQFQLFYRLHQRSLAGVIPKHNCTGSVAVGPSAWVLQLTSQILSAIKYLHKEGIAHQDIKPQNILVDRNVDDGSCHFYLADFGLAASYGQLTGSSRPGTYPYMAPYPTETLTPAMKRKLPYCDDIWSFAVTLGEVLGYWCLEEYDMPDDIWLQKLNSFHIAHEVSYVTIDDKWTRWHQRLSCCIPVLPEAFEQLLCGHATRANAKSCVKTFESEPRYFLMGRQPSTQNFRGRQPNAAIPAGAIQAGRALEQSDVSMIDV